MRLRELLHEVLRAKAREDRKAAGTARVKIERGSNEHNGCNEFINQLDAWMEGVRHPDARAHLRGCPVPRLSAEDLDAIQFSAAALTVADPEPPARIWTALREQLSEEGLISEGGRAAPEMAAESASLRRRAGLSWLDGLFAAIPRPAVGQRIPDPALRARSGSCGPTGFSRTGSPSSSFQRTAPERGTVGGFLRSRLQIRGFSSLSHNLAIVDNYITLCEKSVQEEPDNEVAREYLYQAYQQKVDLLAQMTERGDTIQ